MREPDTEGTGPEASTSIGTRTGHRSGSPFPCEDPMKGDSHWESTPIASRIRFAGGPKCGEGRYPSSGREELRREEGHRTELEIPWGGQRPGAREREHEAPTNAGRKTR